jgi:hypothetical protein
MAAEQVRDCPGLERWGEAHLSEEGLDLWHPAGVKSPITIILEW